MSSGLHSQKTWRPLFPTLKFQAGEPRVELGTVAPQGKSAWLRHPLPFPTNTSRFGTSLPHVLPLAPVSLWPPLYLLSYRAVLSQTLGVSQWQLPCTLVAILMWLWQDASTLFIYSDILTKSLKHFHLYGSSFIWPVFQHKIAKTI